MFTKATQFSQIFSKNFLKKFLFSKKFLKNKKLIDFSEKLNLEIFLMIDLNFQKFQKSIQLSSKKEPKIKLFPRKTGSGPNRDFGAASEIRNSLQKSTDTIFTSPTLVHGVIVWHLSGKSKN